MENIDIKKNVFNNIKDWIDNNKVSVRSFASQLGVSYTSAYRWYSGVCLPDIDLFPAICKIMNISLPDLLGLTVLPKCEQDILYLYANDDNFRNLIDKYMSNDDFKKTIDILVKISK